MALLILLQAKHLTTSFLGMTKDCLMRCLYNHEDYSKLQLHSFQTIHATVREKLKVNMEEMTHKQDLHTTPITLDVGDSVMRHSPERSYKLPSKFMGPYLVTAKLNGNKFKVLDPSFFLFSFFFFYILKETASGI